MYRASIELGEQRVVADVERCLDGYLKTERDTIRLNKSHVVVRSTSDVGFFDYNLTVTYHRGLPLDAQCTDQIEILSPAMIDAILLSKIKKDLQNIENTVCFD